MEDNFIYHKAENNLVGIKILTDLQSYVPIRLPKAYPGFIRHSLSSLDTFRILTKRTVRKWL